MSYEEYQLHDEIDQIYKERNDYSFNVATIIKYHTEFYDRYPILFNSLMDKRCQVDRIHDIVTRFYQAKEENRVEEEGIKVQKEIIQEYITPVLNPLLDKEQQETLKRSLES